MEVQHNFPLKNLNTFGIAVCAKYFAVFHHREGLEEWVRKAEAGAYPVGILGGGSNILFTRDVDGLVLKHEITGLERVGEDAAYVYVKAGGGESWHQFVCYCMANNLAGAENLSLIPGSVGASPIQNIGAYGVELKDIFHELEAFHLKEKTVVTFSLPDCAFGYRESVFKRKHKGEFVILTVTFKLLKLPRFNTSYGAIEQELVHMGVEHLSIQSISQAVINIRRSKLPDPTVIGNAGSFFKNPEISGAHFHALQQKFSGITGYPLHNGNVKLAAGWLIEQCGWKGYRTGDAGCYEKQALVLVNYNHATGKEVYALSEEIVQSVTGKFGVTLEREVNIW